MAALSTSKHGHGCWQLTPKKKQKIWSLYGSSGSICLLRCISHTSRVLMQLEKSFCWWIIFQAFQRGYRGVKGYEAPLGSSTCEDLDRMEMPVRDVVGKWRL